MENHIKHKGMKGINVAGFAAVTAIIIAIVLAVPVGHIAKRVGAVPTVVVSSFLMAGLMCPYGFIETISELMMLSVAFGTALVCFCIADITLIVQTLPDQSMSGQDIGLWNMFQYIGVAIGGAFSGPVLTAYATPMPNTTEFITEYGDGGQSGGGTYYAVAGYRIVYFTAAGVGLMSCFFVYLAHTALIDEMARFLVADLRQKQAASGTGSAAVRRMPALVSDGHLSYKVGRSNAATDDADAGARGVL